MLADNLGFVAERPARMLRIDSQAPYRMLISGSISLDNRVEYPELADQCLRISKANRPATGQAKGSFGTLGSYHSKER
jgi:hypothetical protein